jgi:hypothetical protein
LSAAQDRRWDCSECAQCRWHGPNDLKPSDPCPICGETGEIEDENSTGKNCVSTSWAPLRADLAALLKALIAKEADMASSSPSDPLSGLQP